MALHDSYFPMRVTASGARCNRAQKIRIALDRLVEVVIITPVEEPVNLSVRIQMDSSADALKEYEKKK